MSGFIGLLHLDRSPIDCSLLNDLTASMAYCGPDHQDAWVSGEVGLGHALLGDRPAPAAEHRQPRSLDGRLRIVGDVRIDRRLEFARELRSHGQAVEHGDPDAVLMLHGYALWGERCVEHVTGDFAFAIWDADDRRLFCARDHFGVAPFYYATTKRGIVLGNVLRSLRLHPDVSSALDDDALADFLLFGFKMDVAATTFVDVRSLPPAHALTCQDGESGIRRYWEAPPKGPELRLSSPSEYVEGFRLLFKQAIDERLPSSRLGAHLSGGMDSTSAVATALDVLRSRGADFDLRTYTLSHKALTKDEEPDYAKQIATFLGIPIEHLDVIDYVTRPPDREATWAFPEPIVIASQAAEYEVMVRVRSFARLLLVGLGGDPLFGTPRGRRHRARAAWDALSSGHFPRLGLRTAVRRRFRPYWTHEAPRFDWLDPDFATRVNPSERWRQALVGTGDATSFGELLHPIWPAFFAASHPGFHGVPVKVVSPYFDMRLAEFVRTTPEYPWRQGKHLLREAMRGRLPDAVLRRPKTPLFAETGRVSEDPRYRVALLPEQRRSRRELLKVPALAEYVDVKRALELVDSPAPGTTQIGLRNCFPLAHWLQSHPEGEPGLWRERETRNV